MGVITYETIRQLHNKAVGLITRVCPVCGKIFDTAPGYVYKKKVNRKSYVYFCSYSCSRKAEKNGIENYIIKD